MRASLVDRHLAAGSNWYWFHGAEVAVRGLGDLFRMDDEGAFYVVLLALVERLFGPVNIVAAKMVSAVPSAGSVALVYILGALSFSRVAAVAAALLLCFNSLDVEHATHVNYIELYVFLTLLALHLSTSGFARDNRSSLRIGSAVLAAAILTRVPAILLSPIVFARQLSGSSKRRGRVREALELQFLPWAAISLFVAWCSAMQGGLRGYFAYRQTNHQTMWDALDFDSLSPLATALDTAYQNLIMAFLDSSMRAVEGTVPSFSSHWWAGLVVALLATVGAFRARHKLPVAFFVIHGLVIAVFDSADRYSLFSLGLLYLLACHGFEQGVRTLVRAPWIAGAATLLTALVATIPRIDALSHTRTWIGSEDYLSQCYDPVHMTPYLIADAWFAEHADPTVVEDVMYGSVMVDFCSIATAPVRHHFLDFDQDLDGDNLAHQIATTGADFLVFDLIDDDEHLARLMSHNVDPGWLEDDVVSRWEHELALCDLLRDQRGEIGRTTLYYDGHEICIEPVHFVERYNPKIKIMERLAIARATHPTLPDPPDRDCLYNCCY